MRNVKFALAYLVVIMAISCGVKKKSTSVKVEKSDTLIVKTETVKAPLINDVMTIKEICKDSVLKEFERIFIRETDTVTILANNGDLTLRINQTERILQEKERILQKQSKQVERLEKVVKTRYSLKTILILSSIIVLLWMVPGIPSRINRFVRKMFGSPV